MIAIICPGQGSQTPGFFNPWLEIAAFRASVESMQQASGLDLAFYGTTASEEQIKDTAVAQPLIVASGVASLSALFAAGAAETAITGVAGHSVGEITAAIAAGIFTEEQGIKFVQRRGAAMATAAADKPSGMAAILGGETSDVEARLESGNLEPANYNGAGQIVAAGSLEAIAGLIAEPLAGTRVVPLKVAGAFHTSFMQSAADEMRQYASELAVQDPRHIIWTNKDGSAKSSGAEYLDLLVNQISSPVRWDLVMENMLRAGVTAVIELAPGGTLTGLAKRSMPGVETLALKTPDNLDAALTLISNHS
jgi:[acyl-carrier-protein] S-malonyltransferase